MDKTLNSAKSCPDPDPLPEGVPAELWERCRQVEELRIFESFRNLPSRERERVWNFVEDAKERVRTAQTG
jgi:hypothetical protein